GEGLVFDEALNNELDACEQMGANETMPSEQPSSIPPRPRTLGDEIFGTNQRPTEVKGPEDRPTTQLALDDKPTGKPATESKEGSSNKPVTLTGAGAGAYAL